MENFIFCAVSFIHLYHDSSTVPPRKVKQVQIYKSKKLFQKICFTFVYLYKPLNHKWQHLQLSSDDENSNFRADLLRLSYMKKINCFLVVPCPKTFCVLIRAQQNPNETWNNLKYECQTNYS